MRKLFIYEVRKNLAPGTSEFYCYAIYDTTKHKVLYYIKDVTGRAARQKCRNMLNMMEVQSGDVFITVWRDWPINLWPHEMKEEILVGRIKKKEVFSV